MALYYGKKQISGGRDYKTEHQMEDYSVSFVDDGEGYTDAAAALSEINSGSKFGKLFAAIKGCLMKFLSSISSLSSDLTALQNKATELQNTITELEKKATELQEKTTTLENGLTSCNSDLKNMSNNVVSLNTLAEKTVKRKTLVGQSSNSSNVTNKPWFKVASLSCSNSYTDNNITFLVRSTYEQNFIGILQCKVRTNSTGCFESAVCFWLSVITSSSVTKNNFVLAYNTNTNPTICELWVKDTVSWMGMQFNVLSEGTRGDMNGNWVLTSPGLTDGGYAEPTSGYTRLVSS